MAVAALCKMRVHSFIALLGWLFVVSSTAHASQQEPLSDKPFSNHWRFNFSSPAPHYFASTYGLLQQWSNTFFPNGHSIVPCVIPPFTKLYHGRNDADLPPSPEWFAFDIEMSYGITGSSRDSHMLTYQTTRRAKCMYFDGESATLFGRGQLDTQMLHIWGNLTGPAKPDDGFRFLFGEYARAAGLCDWIQDRKLGGSGWGYEGIVRMNAGFEMIWCNFSSPSIRLVSHLNVTAPLLPEESGSLEKREVDQTSYYPLPSQTRSYAPDRTKIPMTRPGWETIGREPFLRSQSWNWLVSAAAHYGSSGSGPGQGENRVKLNTCGFLSYYSSAFVSQAIPRAETERKQLNLSSSGIWEGAGKSGARQTSLQALMRRRRFHSLENVTEIEASLMRSDSERVMRSFLHDDSIQCSGIDWLDMTNDIVQTYATPLQSLTNNLRQFNNQISGNNTSRRNWVADVRDLTHRLILQFLEYPDDTTDEKVWTSTSQLFRDTFSRCRYQYTRLLDPEEHILLGPEETRLKWAVEEVLGEICRVIIDVGFSIEKTWQADYNVLDVMNTQIKNLEIEVHRWLAGLEELMAWLGWVGEWRQCEKKCQWDETCYIPMWPVIPWNISSPRPYRPGHGKSPYQRPDYGSPGPGYGSPSNGTYRPPRDFNPWADSERDLWEPKCLSLKALDWQRRW